MFKSIKEWLLIYRALSGYVVVVSKECYGKVGVDMSDGGG